MKEFDELLAALDAYLEVRDKLKQDSVAVCHDWDCGMAGELDGSFAAESHREELEKARRALEDSLNNLVDKRVESALRKHGRH
jgi:hypothetical protein